MPYYGFPFQCYSRAETVNGVVVEAIVKGDGVTPISPEQSDQIDARDYMMVLARPVTMDQLDVLGIRFVECRIIDDEAIMKGDMLLGLVPERSGIGVESVEQTGQGLMGSASWVVGLDASGFGAGEDQRRSKQEVDVIEVGDFGLVHCTTILYNLSTAELLTI